MADKTGKLCLELVATVHGRFSPIPRDDLAAATGLAHWLDGMELSVSPSPNSTDLAAFIELREATYRLFNAVSGQHNRTTRHQCQTDVALINKCATGQPPLIQLQLASGPASTISLTGTTDTPTATQVLTAIARDTIDLLANEGHRLHQCEAENCGSFFLDTSRAGRRRWCSATSCGNRARVAAHRQRHAPNT